MPEAFHARLLFLAASPLVSSAKDDSACGRRSSSSDARKKPLVPRVRNAGLFERFRVPLTAKCKREFVPRVQVFPLLFYTKISSFTLVLFYNNCLGLFLFVYFLF